MMEVATESKDGEAERKSRIEQKSDEGSKCVSEGLEQRWDG